MYNTYLNNKVVLLRTKIRVSRVGITIETAFMLGTVIDTKVTKTKVSFKILYPSNCEYNSPSSYSYST